MSIGVTNLTIQPEFIRPQKVVTNPKTGDCENCTCESQNGGVDIEEVAEKTPERIKKVPVDIKTGLTDAMADDIAEFLGFEGDLKAQCSEQVKRLYKMFLNVSNINLVSS